MLKRKKFTTVRWKSKNTYRTGIWAEYYAAFRLVIRGYYILNFRYKTKVGEVDIIAKKGHIIAFIEVKYRQSLDDGVSAISLKSRSRIRRASEHFILGKQTESHTLRFDVIAINNKLKMRHIENAF